MHALRIRRAGCFVSVAAAALLGSSSFAQGQASASVAAGGTVTGHVTCGDTQRPARFAKVILFGVPAEITPPAEPNAKSLTAADYKKANDALSMVQTQTDINGALW